MAKAQDKIEKPKISSAQEKVLGMMTAVARGDLSMAVAESQLHDFVHAMSEEDQEKFRENAKVWGRLLVSVAEAFNQQLTIIAAGQ